MSIENVHILQDSSILYKERGKAGGHKQQHFPTSMSHIIFFCLPAAMSYNRTVFHATALSRPAVITFLNDTFRAFKLHLNILHDDAGFLKSTISMH